jgi:hypothetical protein
VKEEEQVLEADSKTARWDHPHASLTIRAMIGAGRLGFGGVATLAVALLGAVCSASPTRDLKARWYFPEEIDVLSVTVQELQQFLSNGTVTSVQLTQRYLVSGSTFPLHLLPKCRWFRG